jgi:ABC-type Mn2+/Zn2+ transport system permease subunit
MDAGLTASLLMALMIGVASGSIGAFVILRRMALVGDALSHVALPGIALALYAGRDPFWGILASLLGAAPLIWWLEAKSHLPVDAIVGLLFTASLAIGILTIPDLELIEALFGVFPSLSLGQLVLTLSSAGVASVLVFAFAKPFLFSTVSPELARARGIGRAYDLLLLLLFAFVVALGIKLVGTLLMGALTIIPAAIARSITLSMKRYLMLAAALGGGIAVLGVVVSAACATRPGPTMILLGVGFFLLSLIKQR